MSDLNKYFGRFSQIFYEDLKINNKHYYNINNCMQLQNFVLTESPNFPANYPNYAECEWKIAPPIGNRVFLEFSHFEMEHQWSLDDSHTRQARCSFDSLVIEERDNTDSVIKTDTYCASMPKPLNTTHTVVIKFVSTDSNVLL